jgi:hypothetical protein
MGGAIHYGSVVPRSKLSFAIRGKNSRLQQNRGHVTPERQTLRIPTSMPAVIQAEGGVPRCGSEPQTLLPGNEPIVSAMNHQHGPRKTLRYRKVVEVIAQQEARRPMAYGESIERGECRLQDQCAQGSVPCQQTDGTSAERLAEAEDSIRVHAGVCSQAIVGRIHGRPNRLLGRRPGRTAISGILDQQHAHASLLKPAETGNPVVDHFAVAVPEDHRWSTRSAGIRGSGQKQGLHIPFGRGDMEQVSAVGSWRNAIDLVLGPGIDERALREVQDAEVAQVERAAGQRCECQCCSYIHRASSRRASTRAFLECDGQALKRHLELRY